MSVPQVTPLQLANLYATIANGGTVFPSYLISKIINAKGQIDWEHKVEPCGGADTGDKAMPELRRLLQAVIERGTGRAAKIGRPACGKTGTSDGFRDVWFAGFTPQMTAVVSPPARTPLPSVSNSASCTAAVRTSRLAPCAVAAPAGGHAAVSCPVCGS